MVILNASNEPAVTSIRSNPSTVNVCFALVATGRCSDRPAGIPAIADPHWKSERTETGLIAGVAGSNQIALRIKIQFERRAAILGFGEYGLRIRDRRYRR